MAVEAPLAVQSPLEAIPAGLLLTRDDQGVAEALGRRLAKRGRRAVAGDLDRPFSAIAPMRGMEPQAFDGGALGSEANELLRQAWAAVGLVGGGGHTARRAGDPDSS